MGMTDKANKVKVLSSIKIPEADGRSEHDRATLHGLADSSGGETKYAD